MDSFLAVNTLQNIVNAGLKIDSVVMDDDSTTFSRIKTFVNKDIKKCSDNNPSQMNCLKNTTLVSLWLGNIFPTCRSASIMLWCKIGIHHMAYRQTYRPSFHMCLDLMTIVRINTGVPTIRIQQHTRISRFRMGKTSLILIWNSDLNVSSINTLLLKVLRSFLNLVRQTV